MIEIWRDIKDYEGLYQVSNLGRVKNSKTGRILKLYKNKQNGYYYINLSKNGIVKEYTVHRLVAQAFIPNPDNKPYIDHINTIRDDNRVENLQWVTRLENNNNSLTRKHISEAHKGDKNHWYGRYGKNHNRSKPVLQYDLDGNFIREWECISQIYRELGLNKGHISSCCNGKDKTCGGFIWRYY